MAIINIIDKIYSGTERSVTINGILLDDDSQPLANQQLVIAGLNSVIVTSGQDGSFSGNVLAGVNVSDYSVYPISILYKPDISNFVKITTQLNPVRPVIDILDDPIWSNNNTAVKIHGHIIPGSGEKQCVGIGNVYTNTIELIIVDDNGFFDYYLPISYNLSLALMPFDVWGYNITGKRTITINNFYTWSFAQLFS